MLDSILKDVATTPKFRNYSHKEDELNYLIQNALKNLEDSGLIYTDRTNGKFVSNDNKSIEESKAIQLKTLTNDYINKMTAFGLDKKEIIKFIKENLND